MPGVAEMRLTEKPLKGWDEWRKKRHRATLCQADSVLEGATTIPQGSRYDGETPSSEALGPG